ncbi:MAG: hypothetical protein ABI419_05235 [Ginsengibacter sp.]
MYYSINKNSGVILMLFFFGFSAKAQVASSKPRTAFYNNKIDQKLSENPASKTPLKSQGQKQDLPSNGPLIKELANSKTKSPAIMLHVNSGISGQVNKSKLSSNSAGLKQKGYPLIKQNSTH